MFDSFLTGKVLIAKCPAFRNPVLRGSVDNST
jgi:hypothetical protein